MQSLTRLTIFLSLAWVLTLLYGEMLTFLTISSFSCSYPKSRSNLSAVTDQVKVAVLADVKLLDRTSSRVNVKSSSAFETMKFYSDMYMRRAFQMSVLPFRPDVVLFLGDQFDGGAELNDQEWKESVTRFKHVFDLNDERRKSNISVYYSPGNLDIGYLNSHVQYPQVINRYEKEFGARNYKFSTGVVEFVVVDSQTLDGSKSAQTSLYWEFFRNISNANSLKSRVLLTPNPLFHVGSPCGRNHLPLTVNQNNSDADGHEISYRKYLSEETSSWLLNQTKPILVLSAHDHGQCTVNHSTPFGLVEEHTLGSFNWIHENLNPSFMLLTISPPSDSNTSTKLISTSLCFLPMQSHIYIWYLCQFFATLILLAIWPTNGFGCCDRVSEFLSGMKSLGRSLVERSKEKNDDENCDYEMIWDAEGSMHLVKKATSHVSNARLDLGNTIRGNATIRQSARKNIVQEEEMLLLDMSNVKVPRINKSNAAKLISRLFRVIRLLSIIAALNFPIYMMLLFKDWIDR